MKRALLAFFLLFLISGCGSSNVYVKPDESAQAIQNSDLAYVLVSYDGQAYTWWAHTSRIWGEELEALKQLHLSGKTLGGERYFFVQLRPGTYTLANFIQEDFNTRYTISPQAAKQNEAMKHSGGLFASFTVEKGKINYIGQLGGEINHYTKNFNFHIRDRQKEALEYLLQNHPGIDPTNIFVVRLARRGPATR